ncbi:hypothetical protein LCGC14_2727870, partial [marine sediment metagenome]
MLPPAQSRHLFSVAATHSPQYSHFQSEPSLAAAISAAASGKTPTGSSWASTTKSHTKTGKGGWNASGDISVNVIADLTMAYVEDATIATGGDLGISAANDTAIYMGSGAITISKVRGGDSKGLAGSLAVNVTIADTKALVDGDVNVHGAALDVSAIATTDNKVEALSEVTGDVNTGVGASVAVHVVDHTTRAAVESGADIDGGFGFAPASLALTATSDHGLITKGEGGAAGGTAIAASVAFVLSTVDTQAQLGTGVELVTAGAVSVNATHTSAVETTAKGDAEGSDVAIGAALGMNLLTHRTKASTARDIDAGGNVTFDAQTTLTSTAIGSASAGGGDSSDGANGETDAQADNQQGVGNSAAASKGARQNADTSPSASGSATSGNSKANSKSGSGGSGVGVAAAISFNIVTAQTEARITNGADVDAGG